MCESCGFGVRGESHSLGDGGTIVGVVKGLKSLSSG